MFTETELQVFKIVKSEFDKNAVIAGGACRDSLLGGQYKDIDIFLHSRSYKKLSALIENEGDQIFDLGFGDGIERISNSSYSSKSADGPRAVWDLMKDGVRNNIVVISSSFNDFMRETFDLSLCEAWTADGKEIEMSKFCAEDLNKKQLRAKTSHYSSNKSMNRATGILKKYNGIISWCGEPYAY